MYFEQAFFCLLCLGYVDRLLERQTPVLGSRIDGALPRPLDFGVSLSKSIAICWSGPNIEIGCNCFPSITLQLSEAKLRSFSTHLSFF